MIRNDTGGLPGCRCMSRCRGKRLMSILMQHFESCCHSSHLLIFFGIFPNFIDWFYLGRVRAIWVSSGAERLGQRWTNVFWCRKIFKLYCVCCWVTSKILWRQHLWKVEGSGRVLLRFNIFILWFYWSGGLLPRLCWFLFRSDCLWRWMKGICGVFLSQIWIKIYVMTGNRLLFCNSSGERQSWTIFSGARKLGQSYTNFVWSWKIWSEID